MKTSTAHHGSLAREQRLDAEQRLEARRAARAGGHVVAGAGNRYRRRRSGVPDRLDALDRCPCCNASGARGTRSAALPKGRLFPLSRDELCDCAALLDAVRRGELDHIHVPEKPLDVLAQQIVAEVASQEWNEDELLALYQRAYPFRNLTREEFSELVLMLSDGFHTPRGRRSAHLHHDAVNGVLRGRRGAALAAVTSGGAIPDTADYTVMLEPQAQVVGTVHEDFAVESHAGRCVPARQYVVSHHARRARHGARRRREGLRRPAFRSGSARRPARTDGSCRNRCRDCVQTIAARLDEGGREAAVAWLTESVKFDPDCGGSRSSIIWPPRRQRCVSCPTCDSDRARTILRRIGRHAADRARAAGQPHQPRVGFGAAQALLPQVRFRVAGGGDRGCDRAVAREQPQLSARWMWRIICPPSTVRPLLVQALLAAPMFGTRWRWNAGFALALLRFRGGHKVAPQLQRMASEDLLATIFPDQVACGENIVGDREIPDHPLVRQTIDDCLHEAMDIDGLERVLSAIERGQIKVLARDLTEPSPLALEILAARPYAYLDDAPLEERRTQAVIARRWIDPETRR